MTMHGVSHACLPHQATVSHEWRCILSHCPQQPCYAATECQLSSHAAFCYCQQTICGLRQNKFVYSHLRKCLHLAQTSTQNCWHLMRHHSSHNSEHQQRCYLRMDAGCIRHSLYDISFAKSGSLNVKTSYGHYLPLPHWTVPLHHCCGQHSNNCPVCPRWCQYVPVVYGIQLKWKDAGLTGQSCLTFPAVYALPYPVNVTQLCVTVYHLYTQAWHWWWLLVERPGWNTKQHECGERRTLTQKSCDRQHYSPHLYNVHYSNLLTITAAH